MPHDYREAEDEVPLERFGNQIESPVKS